MNKLESNENPLELKRFHRLMDKWHSMDKSGMSSGNISMINELIDNCYHSYEAFDNAVIAFSDCINNIKNDDIED